MIYPRIIESKIEKNLKSDKVIVVTGMRRVGKTTLLKKVFDGISSDNKLWFDFENPLDVKYFNDVDYNDVFINLLNKGLDKKKRIYVFIDEVQHYPEISKIIKYLADHYKIKFILTGSASYYLKNLFPESLAGRKIIFEMFPLNFEEFLIFKSEDAKKYAIIKSKTKINQIDYEYYNKLYEEFIKWGGFPEVALAENLDNKTELLNDIFSSYFQKEIIGLADYRKNDKVRDLILLLSQRVGSKLDIDRLSQELQITRATVYSYLSFLEATYFVYLVSPFSRSIDRLVSGKQKVYFCDNGILKIMAKLSEGQILENGVYNQLKFYGKVNYYQQKSGNEIDFIVDKSKGYEVKKTATAIDMKRAEKISQKLKLDSINVISQNYAENIKNIKFAQFL